MIKKCMRDWIRTQQHRPQAMGMLLQHAWACLACVYRIELESAKWKTDHQKHSKTVQHSQEPNKWSMLYFSSAKGERQKIWTFEHALFMGVLPTPMSIYWNSKPVEPAISDPCSHQGHFHKPCTHSVSRGEESGCNRELEFSDCCEGICSLCFSKTCVRMFWNLRCICMPRVVYPYIALVKFEVLGGGSGPGGWIVKYYKWKHS